SRGHSSDVPFDRRATVLHLPGSPRKRRVSFPGHAAPWRRGHSQLESATERHSKDVQVHHVALHGQDRESGPRRRQPTLYALSPEQESRDGGQDILAALPGRRQLARRSAEGLIRRTALNCNEEGADLEKAPALCNGQRIQTLTKTNLQEGE